MKRNLKYQILTVGLIAFIFFIVECVSYFLISNNLYLVNKKEINDVIYKLDSFEAIETYSKQTEASRERELANWLLDWGINKFKSFPAQAINTNLQNDIPIYKRGGVNTGIKLKQVNGRYPKNLSDDYVMYGSGSGKEIYRVRYKINKYGRRETGFEESNKDKDLVFIGCSYTFGDGLINNETFPVRYGFYDKSFNIFNHGISATSAADYILNIQNEGTDYFDGKVSGDNLLVIYTYIVNHLIRDNSTIDYFRKFKMPFKNKYFSENNGDLSLVSFPLKQRLYWVLSKSNFLKVLRINWPSMSKRHVIYTAKLIDKVKKEILRIKPSSRFYVSIFPSEMIMTSALKQELDNLGISYFDYSTIETHALFKTWRSQANDGHPSKYVMDMYAYLLSRDIEKLN